jgi:prepilin-type N-terminal cleavage/methylation domain-containing protein
MKRLAFPHLRRDRAAFTLLELLVVIFIIAILAGLLLPVMSNIRARGDNVQCVANLHQIGIAIGTYVADNDGTLPGPLSAGQYPTYTNTDTTSLANALVKYLSLPSATAAKQKAQIFLCPSYAKLVPALDSPVYAVDDISKAVPLVSPFGVSGGSQPLRLSALTGLIDSNGAPISLANTIALRDFTKEGATLATTWVTWTSAHPVHRDHLNALFYDWHVGAVDTVMLLPK